MAQQQTINYPDVLGFVAKEARHTVGPVEMSLAVRPQAVKAGKPFEVILVMQNTVDTPVDVSLTLQLPDKDANGQKGRFLHGTDRLVVGLASAEVGYAMLPISTLPDTAPADGYAIGLDISVKADGKAERVRQGDSEGEFDPKTLPTDKRERLADLVGLTFSAKKRGFLRGNALETSVSVLPGKVGAPLKLKAGWHSLWTLEDISDTTALIEKYRDVMKRHMLPKLRTKTVYPLLHDKVTTIFKAADYPLKPIEAMCITKLMTRIVEYVHVERTVEAMQDIGIYDIQPLLAVRSAEVGEPKRIPHWFDKMLRALVHDERVAKVPAKGLAHFAFFELLYDAIMHGFTLVEKASGEGLGNEAEMQTYAENLLDKIKNKKPLDFSAVYLPLVLGGVAAFDRIALPDENHADGLNELKYLLDERADERNDDTEMIFDIAQLIINNSLKKYGSLDNRL